LKSVLIMLTVCSLRSTRILHEGIPTCQGRDGPLGLLRAGHIPEIIRPYPVGEKPTEKTGIP
jgi:hypothetical protein